MKTMDYVICGLLIAICLAIGLAWIITKGKFAKYNKEYSPEEEARLRKRSVLAGVFYIAIAVFVAIAMVAIHFQITWLMIVCFVAILVSCLSFVVISRLIYRRRK